MKRGLIAACLLVLVTACGGGGEPDVDWSKVPSYQHVGIDQAVAAKDCGAMQSAFDASSDSDVLSYLDWHMKTADCY